MLARAGLRNDPRFSHAAGEQDLSEAVVDLVRAGMIEVFALQINFRRPQMLREPLGEIERTRPADIVAQQPIEFRPELRIALRRLVGDVELQNERHQRFGDEAPAIGAEVTC